MNANERWRTLIANKRNAVMTSKSSMIEHLTSDTQLFTWKFQQPANAMPRSLLFGIAGAPQEDCKRSLITLRGSQRPYGSKQHLTPNHCRVAKQGTWIWQKRSSETLKQNWKIRPGHPNFPPECVLGHPKNKFSNALYTPKTSSQMRFRIPKFIAKNTNIRS